MGLGRRDLGRGDTIAAVATPVGVGGVGIVRLSGPEAVAIAAQVIGRRAAELEDRRMVHAVARDERGARVDDVLAVAMRAPRSFTGEDVAELHGHGGAVNMARLLRAVLARGARHAEPGEFTRRAFENERIDLTRAEAIAGVIEATSERALRLAQAQLEGGLGARVDALRVRLTEVLAEVEGCIDFPEEGLAFLDGGQVAARAAGIGEETAALARSFAVGQVIRDGVDVALVGAVNAGKSSLFNALLGTERALVAAEPGTTRDFVEAQVSWDGLRVTLIDTAGERSADGEVERRGIELGRRRAEAADLRLVIREAGAAAASTPLVGEAAVGELGARDLLVLSKVDQSAAGVQGAGAIRTSVVTGEGLEALKAAIVARALRGATEGDEGTVVTSERQRGLLEQAAAAIGRAVGGMRERRPTELVAADVREAAMALAAIVGEEVGEEVLDEVFRRFCIGK